MKNDKVEAKIEQSWHLWKAVIDDDDLRERDSTTWYTMQMTAFLVWKDWMFVKEKLEEL